VTTTSTQDKTTVAPADDQQRTTAKLTETEKQELQKRAQERVNALKVKLNAAEQTRIKAKCKAAQGMLSSYSAKANTVYDKRTEVYGGVIARLSQIGTRLKNQGVDNTKIQAHIDELKAKNATFATDFAAYKQAVADVAAIDCAADPNGFKASLQAARTAQEKLRTDSKDVRTYIDQSVKPTLKEIKNSLGGNQ
jgi:hypothetical protein